MPRGRKGVDTALLYTPAERAVGVDVMIRHMGHATKPALKEIKELIGKDIPGTTVCGWYRKWKEAQAKIDLDAGKGEDSVTIALVDAAKKPLDEIFESVARRFLEHAAHPDVIQKMNGRDALQGAATAVDRLHMLRDVPPELVNLLPVLTKVFKLHGDYARQAVEALCMQLESVVVPKAKFLIPSGDYIEGQVIDSEYRGVAEEQVTGVLQDNEAIKQL